jgi:hypothetical protein
VIDGNGRVVALPRPTWAESKKVGDVLTGVIPLDRRPAEDVLAAIRATGVPEDRLTVGVGSGAGRTGALARVRDAVAARRHATASTSIQPRSLATPPIATHRSATRRSVAVSPTR